MTAIAPHLTRPAANLFPLGDATPAAMGAAAEAGMRVADTLRALARTPRRLLPRPSRISAAEALALVPGLRRADLRGALLHWDGQLEDDARLVTAVARTAAGLGADIVTRCSALELGDRTVLLRDELTGATLEARGHVVNATGVWAGEHEPGLTHPPQPRVAPRRARLGAGWPAGHLLRPGRRAFGRSVFAIPQPDGLVLLGLTDVPASDVDPIAPAVPDEDVRFLLETINGVLERPLSTSDVVGRYAGLRPLVRGPAVGASADVSRRHLLLDEPGRPVTIAGGKLTTYRQMAQDAVDAVCRRAGIATELPHPHAPPRRSGAARRPGRTFLADARLVRRYGTEAVGRRTTRRRCIRIWLCP